MDVVHKCYLYIKKQFTNCQNVKTYEQLEEEFADFCKTQEEKPPPFREIWEESEEYDNLKKFNKEFEKTTKEYFKQCNLTKEQNFINCFQEGYGQYMDISEYQNQDIQDINTKTNITKIIPLQKNKHEFTTSLIIYEEPNANPVSYGHNLRYDVTKIDDFTVTLENSNITLNDYKKVYVKETDKLNVKDITQNRPNTLDELIKKREDFIKISNLINQYLFYINLYLLILFFSFY